MQGSSAVVEVVVFSLTEDASEEQLLATSEAVSAWAKDQPGFVSRDLYRSEDEGKWIDIVRWESMEAAHAAAESAMSSESCAPMFRLIDMDSTLMVHGEPVAATEAVA